MIGGTTVVVANAATNRVVLPLGGLHDGQLAVGIRFALEHGISVT